MRYIALSSNILNDCSAATLLSVLNNCDVSAVELNASCRQDEVAALKARVELLKGEGVEFSALGALIDWSWIAQGDFLKRSCALEILVQTNAPIFNLYVLPTELPIDSHADQFRSFLQRLSELAELRDRIITVENVAWMRCASLLSSPATLATFLDSIDLPQIQLALDPANAFLTGNHLSDGIVKQIGHRAGHLHIKNFLPSSDTHSGLRMWQDVKGDTYTAASLSHGVYPVGKVASNLFQSGYSGGVTIEALNSVEALRETVTALRSTEICAEPSPYQRI